MERAFQEWLVNRGNLGAARSYPGAIHQISQHYSQETGQPTNIYAITDQRVISEIAHDYSQAGRFSTFGYEQHGRFRAAIARYSEFFSQPRDGGQPAIEEPQLAPAQPAADAASSINFAYEKDLRSALCAQISELFPEYKIFGDNLLGVEYSIGDRRIDVLLEHRTQSDLLVVELKAGVADYRTFGQVCMYMGLLQAQFPGRPISAVIVAGSVDESLRQASSTTDRVALKVYRMSVDSMTPNRRQPPITSRSGIGIERCTACPPPLYRPADVRA